VTVKTPGGKPAEKGAGPSFWLTCTTASLRSFRPAPAARLTGLYPNRTGTAYWNPRLGRPGRCSPTTRLIGHRILDYPTFRADDLLSISGYGIGGPGPARYVWRAGSWAESSAGSSPKPLRRPWPHKRGGGPGLGREGQVRGGRGQPADPKPRPKGARRRRSCARIPETAFWQPHLLTGDDGTRPSSSPCPTASRAGASSSTASPAISWAGRSRRRRSRSRTSWSAVFAAVSSARATRRAPGHGQQRRGEGRGGAGDARDHGSGDGREPGPRPSGFPARRPAAAFTVKPGGSAVAVRVRAPRGSGRWPSRSWPDRGALSDGELRPLPVLPGRMHLVQSRFATLKEGKTRELSFRRPGQDGRRDPHQRTSSSSRSTAQLFYGS